MDCEFQSLYFGKEGYIIRCKNCGYYQVAFLSVLLNLSHSEFNALHNIVKFKCGHYSGWDTDNTKNVIIQTPGPETFILLTITEARQFMNMLEEADNEAKALLLIDMFNA
ncbi:MAG: hypothetical protein QM629_04130 [Parafilimonas sp.]